VLTGSRRREYLLLENSAGDVLKSDIAQALNYRKTELFALLSEHLFRTVRNAVTEIFPTDAEYEINTASRSSANLVRWSRPPACSLCPRSNGDDLHQP
jgi:hypothetical protein